jgi:hypothetical protein
VQLPLDRDELLALMQDSLESLPVELDLLVASDTLEDEVARFFWGWYQRVATVRMRGMVTSEGW